MNTGAIISDCGKYRYALWRGPLEGRLLCFIMLNPSTADAEKDDPTIRACRDFAQRNGYNGIYVVNLYAYRATKPADMRKAADPFGPGNAQFLRETVAKYPTIVCAWGAVGGEHDPDHVHHVTQLLQYAGANTVCLGKTSVGHPRHPLYVKRDQPLIAYP